MDKKHPMRPLGPDETFLFGCGPQVTCFNACCQDLNQFLTPYDLLRLKQALGLDSGRVLADYILLHTGPATGLPVATITPGPGRVCPFVEESGCRIYRHRPSSCRLYPLARVAGRDPATGAVTQRFFLITESHCQGHESGEARTAAQWVENQGLTPYFQFNDQFMEIIAAKQKTRGVLSPSQAEIFRLACYDLDEFAVRLARGELPGDRRHLESAPVDGPPEDLLVFAMDWVKGHLFGRPE